MFSSQTMWLRKDLVIDVSFLDMLYSQYGGGGDNQQETMQKLNALQQWQQPPQQQQQQQQNRRYGPWEAIAQIANVYAQKQGLQNQLNNRGGI